MFARICFAVLLTSSIAGSCWASDVKTQVLVDNFGTGDTFDTSFGYVLGGANLIQQGPSFTVTGGNFKLDYIDAAIGFFSGSSDAGNLAVYSEADGNPGILLESVTVIGFPDFGGSFSPTRFEFSSSTVLQEGETYFLIGSSVGKSLPGNDSTLLWAWNNTGDNRDIRFRFGDGPWEVSSNTVAPALRIVGTAIPEPGIFWMLTTSLVCLFARRKRGLILDDRS